MEETKTAEELAKEIVDFDLVHTKIVYEIWLLGYGQDMNATDFEYFLDGDYTDVNEAKKCVQYFSDKNILLTYLEDHNLPVPADTKHVHLFLEECIDLGEDGTECQDIVEEVEIF